MLYFEFISAAFADLEDWDSVSLSMLGKFFSLASFFSFYFYPSFLLADSRFTNYRDFERVTATLISGSLSLSFLVSTDDFR